jgi:hypothetical protein
MTITGARLGADLDGAAAGVDVLASVEAGIWVKVAVAVAKSVRVGLGVTVSANKVAVVARASPEVDAACTVGELAGGRVVGGRVAGGRVADGRLVAGKAIAVRSDVGRVTGATRGAGLQPKTRRQRPNTKERATHIEMARLQVIQTTRLADLYLAARRSKGARWVSRRCARAQA